jgi:hypothetical protein
MPKAAAPPNNKIEEGAAIVRATFGVRNRSRNGLSSMAVIRRETSATRRIERPQQGGQA